MFKINYNRKFKGTFELTIMVILIQRRSCWMTTTAWRGARSLCRVYVLLDLVLTVSRYSQTAVELNEYT